MKRLGLLLLGWMLAVAAAAAEKPAVAAAEKPAVAATEKSAAAASVPPDSGLTFRLEIGSRLYPNWHEEQRVHMDRLFYLGDSEFSARVRRFVPDFRIGEKGEILNVSAELKNPAIRVFVYHDSTAADSTWAFLNFPPHYSPRSFFTFQLKEISGYTPPPASATTPPDSQSTASETPKLGKEKKDD